MDESFYEKGLKEYNKENYLHAFACFENSVKHEKYPDSYYYLAEIYLKKYKGLDLLSSNINLSFLCLINGINESSELCLQAFIKYFILEYEKVDFLSDCILLFLKHYKKEIDTKLRLDLFNIIDFWFNKERKANKPPKQILKNINLFIENSNDKFIKAFLKAKINEIY